MSTVWWSGGDGGNGGVGGLCFLSDSQQVEHGSGKVELICVLQRLEGSQSLGGAREFRLMRGKTVTSVSVWHVTVGWVGKKNNWKTWSSWRPQLEGCSMRWLSFIICIKTLWGYVMLDKKKTTPPKLFIHNPPPPGPHPLTTTQLIPALSIVLVLPRVFPGIPGRGGALNYEKQPRGEKS